MSSRTFITREKSVPDLKASKDRQTVLLGADEAGDFKSKPVLTHHSENSRALKNHAQSALPLLYKWKNKAWITAHLFATWFN